MSSAPTLGGTGVFDYVANAVAPGYSIVGQLRVQLQGVLLTIAWSAVVAWLAFRLVDRLVGLRVSEEDERQGLDISAHGETAYHR